MKRADTSHYGFTALPERESGVRLGKIGPWAPNTSHRNPSVAERGLLREFLVETPRTAERAPGGVPRTLSR